MVPEVVRRRVLTAAFRTRKQPLKMTAWNLSTCWYDPSFERVRTIIARFLRKIERRDTHRSPGMQEKQHATIKRKRRHPGRILCESLFARCKVQGIYFIETLLDNANSPSLFLDTWTQIGHNCWKWKWKLARDNFIWHRHRRRKNPVTVV